MLKIQIWSCLCITCQKTGRIILTQQVCGFWFYFKDETTDFDVHIVGNNDFKSFKYNAEFLGNTECHRANGILKNTTIAAPLKYLSSFWISLEMPLINCKVELKLK